jgi:hypothetical protein
MNDKPQRRWFQIHLSTAIVLAVAGGALLWANMQPNLFFSVHHYGNIGGMGATYYGYPFCVFSTTGFPYDPAAHDFGRIIRAALNILVTLVPLGMICEFRVRHRWLRLNCFSPGLLALGSAMFLYCVVESGISRSIGWLEPPLSPETSLYALTIPAASVILATGLCLEHLLRQETIKP